MRWMRFLPLSLIGACSMNSPTTTSTCPESISQFCATTTCAPTLASAATIDCANGDSSRILIATAPCHGMIEIVIAGVDTGTDHYYDATTGKLVAIVDFNANFGGHTSCIAGPASFDAPTDCNGPFVALCAPPPDGGSAGADQSPPGVSCGSGKEVFPTFDKQCASTSDCALGIHQIDCCGSHLEIGFNASEVGAFQADEKACESMLPLCECDARETIAEDGKSPSAGHPIVVTCDAGRCMTSVP